MPDITPDGPLGKNKGVLSPLGDTLGQVLNTTLKPTLGAVTGAIGKPNGEAGMGVMTQMKKELGFPVEDEEKPKSDMPGGDRIGGNAQTGQNPLGL